MKFTVKIKPPNDVHDWDDLMDPAKKDSEDYTRASIKRYMNSLKESIKIVNNSDFIISIKRKALP